MFIVASVYLLGIIVIMGLFLLPNLKERFAQIPNIEEQYPMLVSNYSSYSYEGRVIWLDRPDTTIPIIAAEKYGTHVVYQGNVQTGSFEGLQMGVFAAKKTYVIYVFPDGAEKPNLFGPFEQ